MTKRWFGDDGVIIPFPEGTMHLDLVEGPLDLVWKHCGLTADFLGDYYSIQTAGSEQARRENQYGVTYVVNELLENAIKFRCPGNVTITSRVDRSAEGKKFRLCISNWISEDTAEAFASFLADFTDRKGRDPSDLLIERIEENAADPNSKASGLGLLTLMSDYDVRLAWSFEGPLQAGNSVRLESHAVLPLA